MAMGSKAFESPLISHARMRAMYRALVEARVLGERCGRGSALPKGLEACFVGTSIDLRDGDATSGPYSLWTDYFRGVGLRPGAPTASSVRAFLSEASTAKSGGGALPVERLFCAVGRSMSIQDGVVVAYVGHIDLTAAEWTRLLTVAAPGALPLVLVVLPGRGTAAVDLAAIARRVAKKSTMVPVIPVDAGDVVAIYRVSQETLVRARADGGVALIECVDCRADPVVVLGGQLVKKGICTAHWVAEVETALRTRLART